MRKRFGLTVISASWLLVFSHQTLVFAANRASDDSLGVLRSLIAEEPVAPAFNNGFSPRLGEAIVLLGGTDVVFQQSASYFETLATMTWADKKLRFRNLGWQADTVYRQQRPLYFYDPEHFDQQKGSSPDQRSRVEAGTVFLRFGKMESLDGLEALEKFDEAYSRLLDELTILTPRLVLITPTPFFNTGPAAGLANSRNAILASYVNEIRRLADQRKLPLIDLFAEVSSSSPYSANGVHLNDEGQQFVARKMIEALTDKMVTVDFDSPEFETLRNRIAYKNSIWLQYYHPTNWAFLYGDRQSVPSSRDHEDSSKRWFPFEVEKARSLMEIEEIQIQKLTGQDRISL
jgi:hypothetical protein